MNRNVESHFSNIPGIDIQRSVFDRSSTHKTSFNVGDLIPVYVDEVLPGDTWQMDTSKVVRLQTLLDPIMDNIYLDTYFFFVPNRLVWSHWKEFCGENRESAWIPETVYRVPALLPPSGGFWKGSLADYFGLPLGVDWDSSSALAPNALPTRAYSLIFDEFFRDQNTMSPTYVYTGDADTTGATKAYADGGQMPYQQTGHLLAYPFKVSKYHDYFTSCLPSPQKHSPVKTPVDIPQIPILTGVQHGTFRTAYPTTYTNGTVSKPLTEYTDSTASWVTGTRNSVTKDIAFDNLWFPGTNNPAVSEDTSAGISVNDLRIAFQLQKFYERCARGGTRYSEFIRSQFSTDVPDARVQRPEYLGGNRIALSVHEVTNNAQSELDFLGDLGAMSVTADHHSDFIHSFTEHGYIIGVACARYDHTYSQGLERFWTRRDLTDFYLPVFANIGEQPVYTAEIYATQENMNSKDVFGYQEAWADYRYKPNRVSSEMRPNVQNSLASWHLADNYTAPPTLSRDWMVEDKSNVDRVLAVSSSVSNQIFADLYFDCKVTRPMPMYSIPGLIDHN